MKYLQVEKTSDNIVAITINCPDSKVNKVSSGLLKEISDVLDQIEKEEVTGVAIVSGKADNFVVGADIDELRSKTSDKEVERYIRSGHDILNRLASIRVPKVCAIHGNCLGGGLELTLVADWRIASDSTATVFGLPEVMIGLLPAAGGTHRLPRLVGLRTAMPLMLTGKNLRVKKAKRLGLVDEVVMPHGLKDVAIKRARMLAKKREKRKRKRSLVDFLLESNPIGRGIVFSQARKMVMRQTRGLYPAPLEIIDSVEYGYKKGVLKGLDKDAERFVRLVGRPETKSLMSIFFGMTALKKNPLEKKAKPVRKLAVLGAGLMGSGIAAVSTPVCETLLLKDMTLDAVARGMKEIWKGIAKQVKSGAIEKFEGEKRYGRIVPCDDYRDFRNTDIVIEAVFEDLKLKRKILGDIEANCEAGTIFASNTSSIPIKSIAQGCRRPQNVIGMHYFSPVTRMPLLEIIKTEKTADWVVATALDTGIRQGKTCIIVRDGPGFYTTRILAPLLFEGGLLLSEGAEMQDIDRAMHQFGYPVGPITLLDEVGIDVGAHVAETLSPIMEPRGITSPKDMFRMIEKGYLGRKSGMGMYRYDVPKKKGRKPVNQDVYVMLGNAPRRKFAVEEIQQRVSLMMVNEAALCLQEGIIPSPQVGDMGAILGLGFPPFRGGPFRYVDSTGTDTIVSIMEGLAEKHGVRFTPAPILVQMTKKKNSFYRD
ncbi:MAG: enoyl-CoA hydratase/isomerase family protein [Spirochaetes bacterium]|nr:enoyl-CoA hydratase/isomerase family protein [Spirochaetota bacterium]